MHIPDGILPVPVTAAGYRHRSSHVVFSSEDKPAGKPSSGDSQSLSAYRRLLCGLLDSHPCASY